MQSEVPKKILLLLAVVIAIVVLAFTVAWGLSRIGCRRNILFDENRHKIVNITLDRNYCIRYGFTEVPVDPY